MEVRVDGRSGPVVNNVDEVLRQVQEQLREQQKRWLAQLRDQPGTFADLEAHIHQTFQDVADQVVAGVLAEVTAADDFAKVEKKKFLSELPDLYVRPKNDRLCGCVCWVAWCCG
jgi:hypothetical protein